MPYFIAPMIPQFLTEGAMRERLAGTGPPVSSSEPR